MIKGKIETSEQKQSVLFASMDTILGIPDPPSPTQAGKEGSCPGESLPTALQIRVQPTVQQCLRQ